jgi:2-amino-4-hydroxy-6-hydroxymethyldihydropteridine diphosphokinase
VLIPWLAVQPAATLTVADEPRAIAGLLDDLGPAERDGVRATELALH